MLINPFSIESKNEKVEKEVNNIDEIKGYIQNHIIDKYIDYIKNDKKEEIVTVIKEILYEKYNMVDVENVNNIVESILDKMFGYGILQKYIDDINVTDIRAVKYNHIYIRIRGKWEKIQESFKGENEFYEYDKPIAVVSDNKYKLRIEAGISPVNLISPNLVIRIHRPNDISLEELYVKENMLDAISYELLNNVINNNSNVIISGKGGSGKTTLLGALLKKIPSEKAITINEETVELYIENRNVVEREILENRDESKKVTLEKLMKHSLVMSNDVLVIGELKRR